MCVLHFRCHSYPLEMDRDHFSNPKWNFDDLGLFFSNFVPRLSVDTARWSYEVIRLGCSSSMFCELCCDVKSVLIFEMNELNVI